MLLLVLLINDKFDYIKYNNDLNLLSFRYVRVLGFLLVGRSHCTTLFSFISVLRVKRYSGA